MRTRPLVLTLAILAAACGSEEPRQRAPAAPAPVSIRTAYLDDVVPLIDGGAYAVALESIWYLTGTNAVRVRAVGDSATIAEFAAAISLNVQPAVDGGAYAYGLEGGVWRLEADSAVLVKEAASIPADTTVAVRTPDSLGWLLYAKERRARASAEGEDTAEEELPYEPDDEGP